jgi:very-short-patch-repair endonuclease
MGRKDHRDAKERCGAGPNSRAAMAQNGHDYAHGYYNWNTKALNGQKFVKQSKAGNFFVDFTEY